MSASVSTHPRKSLLSASSASQTRESMEFDVLIVGAGPAGLATACHLAQLATRRGLNLTICLLEKAAEVGARAMGVGGFSAKAQQGPNVAVQFVVEVPPKAATSGGWLEAVKGLPAPVTPTVENQTEISERG